MTKKNRIFAAAGNMNVEELYERCEELAKAEPSASANRFMHETLVLCCAEALKASEMAFGNLFSQVDYLVKRCGMSVSDRTAVQQMRRYSNHTEVSSREEWLQHVRSLTQLVSALFNTSIPDGLTRLIPHHSANAGYSPHPLASKAPYVRCIVNQFDGQTLWADTSDGKPIEVDYSGHTYLTKMLRQGMQLNLLDCRVEGEGGKIVPAFVVAEPDFLIDISAVARCFQGNYGHHPLFYTAERLKQRSNTQAILLGNFAGALLDDIIRAEAGNAKVGNNASSFTFDRAVDSFFRKQALQVATCENFNNQTFTDDARQQAINIEEAVSQLFNKDYNREKALLEPSFVCEQLGLQGRIDLMTSDMRLLVEQKSGKNYSLERNAALPSSPTPTQYKEEHYVQLLLYYGILRYNFGRTDSQVDIRLLYSRYPAARGLLYVNFYRHLFGEAIRLRNQIVATELLIARKGFGCIRHLLRPDVVFRDAERDGYFHRYIEPPLTQLASHYALLTPTELAYYDRMMTFIYREQLLSKVGRQEGQGSAVSDLWNMPLAEKLETGNIILSDRPSATLNFRQGDMVYIYNYDDTPDVRKAILYKGVIEEIGSNGVKVRLNNGQQQANPMLKGTWAIEHADSDINTNSAIKGLHQFITADPRKRTLLLGGLTPKADTTLRLSRSYHPHYDDVLLQAKQARDYYLLVGPPGTGKTSMALRYLVEEERSSLQAPLDAILLMAYTNRAVDEICAMLDDAGHKYLRISNNDTCPENIDSLRIVVGTTSMLQARPAIFQKKHFSLCIVDEASQITEPGLVGLLSSDRIDRFILVGDHKQLPAVVHQTEQESKVSDPLLTAIGISDCRQSLFERLLLWERHCGRMQFTGILRRQGRMHPAIAQFPNQMFYHNERLEAVPLEHQLDTSLHYDLPAADATDELLKQRRVIFMDAGYPDRHAEAHQGFSDKANPVEARIVADLLRRIHRFYGNRFSPEKTVGVIVPYRNQIAMIYQEIAQLGLPQLEQISIDTVERYQGSQRDVIIYSFTVSRPYQLDFLTSNCFMEDGRTIDRKLNVAITRARKQLIMTGNASLLRRNPVFGQLIDFAK